MTTPASRPGVFIVSTYYPPVMGGAETAAAQLAGFLAAEGRRVTVITKRTDAAVPREETRHGVHVVRVAPTGVRTAWGKWLALPAMARELIRRRGDGDVVVCVDYRAIALAAFAARWRTGHPLILQAQTDGVSSFAALRRGLSRVGIRSEGLARLFVRPLQQLYNRGDAYPCISHSIEAETLAAGVPADRIHYSPNPVETRVFTAGTADQRAALRAQHGIPPDARVAIIVGRLSREKGQMEALQAWKAAGLTGALLALVGPDMQGHPWNTGPAARAFVEREGLGGSVRFFGGVPQAEIVNYLRLADVSIQPSYFEAFGTSAIEAMAVGLPVIASDVGGLRDFVEPEVNGLRVPARSPEHLAAAIARVLGDDALRARLAEGARRTAPRFDTERVLGEFGRLIDRLHERRRQRRTGQ